jgi:hypothetical protein
MKTGKDIHKRVYKYLRNLGFLKASEVRVGDDLFHGYVDAIIKLPNEKEMPLEIKTVGEEEFDDILKKGKPTWQSYLQLQLYLHYLNKWVGKILFIETDTLNDSILPLEKYISSQRMKEFNVVKNQKVICRTMKKFKKLKEILVKKGVMSR